MADSTEAMKVFYKAKYRDKSKSELQAIALSCVQFIATVPTSASSDLIAKALDKAAERDACNELLQERRKHEERIKAAIEAWKADADKRRDDAIVHLPNAVSPNGQLIAAILEDEGSKTADELLSWCDELATLSDEDGVALLSGLVSEGVIELHADGKYTLLTICTETLYPENAYMDALQKVRDKKLNNATMMSLLLFIIATISEAPVTWEEISNALNIYGNPKLKDAVHKRVHDDMEVAGLAGFDPNVIDKACAGNATNPLMEIAMLKKQGILVEYHDVKSGYYFPMLGMNKQ